MNSGTKLDFFLSHTYLYIYTLVVFKFKLNTNFTTQRITSNSKPLIMWMFLQIESKLPLHDYATSWSPLKISLTRHIPLKVNLEKKISPQTWQFLCLVWEGPTEKVLDASLLISMKSMWFQISK